MTAYTAMTRNMSADELLSEAERETVVTGSAVAELINYMRDVQSDLEALAQIEDHLDYSVQELAADFETWNDCATWSKALMQELSKSSADDLPGADDVAEYLRNRKDTEAMANYAAELMECFGVTDPRDLPACPALERAYQESSE